MTRVEQQLMACPPLPRGERLARWIERGGNRSPPRWWWWEFDRMRWPWSAYIVRRRALPLRMARERLQQLRATLTQH